MSHPIKCPRKLIEVALPLDAINESAAKEKSIRHGHPSTLHLWWARRPLAAARAVIFAQMVNDPSWRWELEHPGEAPPSTIKASWAASRKRLFSILEQLVQWKSTTDEEILERARNEIRKSWHETCELNRDHPQAAELFNPNKLPGFHDPFAGGGAIPLEAQRLGLESYASDLNPVAVLINKATIEIPPKFAGKAPVNPIWRESPPAEKTLRQWQGAQGLADDVGYYGQWMRDEAKRRIGALYPAVKVTAEMAAHRPDLKSLAGQDMTVIAWLWARTIKSPNPAYRHVDVPLTTTFVLSSKEGKEAYVEPLVNGDRYAFTVKLGRIPAELQNGTAAGKRAAFRCLVSGVPIDYGYIRAEAQAGRMGQRLLAIVAEGKSGRVYLPPSNDVERVAQSATPTWKPDVEFYQQALGFRVGNYGMTKWSDLFTPRQLVALSTFSDLVSAARERIHQDAIAAGMLNDGCGIANGGSGASAYADAVSVYLAFAIDKAADYWSTICSWHSSKELIRNTFGRQAIPMVWDYAETNVFSDSAGNVSSGIEWAQKALGAFPLRGIGHGIQAAAQNQEISKWRVVSTDPPYYDNVGYADLSDFFYVWLRRPMKSVFPDLFATVTVPKSDELVATPDRHGGTEEASQFFLNGMVQVMHELARQAHPAFPVTIYYAFKQSETQSATGTSSTGWETFLDAVLRAGFALSGTWPMRTELGNRMRSVDSNALASSIVLVCRPRDANAVTTSRRAFQRELNTLLPEALDEMTRGAGQERAPVAPVDLSQAIIGPGMAAFSKYAAVLEADGKAMTVETALRLINRFLAEDDFDHDTQFCLHWFEQHGWGDGRFGDADTLARAKGTSVDGVRHGGVLYASGGVVRLLKWADYSKDWDPATDRRLPIWEVLHQLIRTLKTEGESGAGDVLAAVQAKAEATRQLAYRLYTLCERAGWAEDARAYNEIITSWNAIESAATRVPGPKQTTLFDR